MNERIVIDPNIHFGHPCVAGTRITVENVLEVVKAGYSFSDIMNNYYPDLTVEDIQACIQYAMDVVSVEEIHLAAATP